MSETEAETPRTRYYKFRANARAGREASGGGAFNGTCLVYEGDEFYMLIPVVKQKLANGTEVLSQTKMPTWADAIAEYEVPRAPRLIKGEPQAPRSLAELNRTADAPSHILAQLQRVPFDAPVPLPPAPLAAPAAMSEPAPVGRQKDGDRWPKPKNTAASERMKKAWAERKAKSTASEPAVAGS